EVLAVLGEHERAQRASTAAGHLDDAKLERQRRAIEQLIQIEIGNVPEALEPKASVLLSAAMQLARQGQYPRALECALADPAAEEGPLDSSAFKLRRAFIIHSILVRELFDAVPDPQPLTPAQRLQASEAARAALAAVNPADLAPESVRQMKRLKHATAELA